MSPLGLGLFLVGVFALRMTGGFALGSILGDNDRWTRLLALLPLAIVAAVVAVQTFTIRQHLTLDARAVGVAVAVVAAWYRLPLGVVVVMAAATTTLVRQAGWG